MRKFRFIAPALIMIGGFLMSTTASFGTVEYTKKEKKGCVVCHVKATSKELNKVGECYQKNGHSMKGCEAEKK
jgi:hypothetical protein